MLRINYQPPKIFFLPLVEQGGAYIQCLDPRRYTGGGTVTFRIVQHEKLPEGRYQVPG